MQQHDEMDPQAKWNQFLHEDKNKSVEPNCNSILHLACQHDAPSWVILKLLEGKVNVSLLNASYQVAARYCKNVQSMRYMMQFGLEDECRGELGVHLLDSLVVYEARMVINYPNYYPIMLVLLQYGANPYQTSPRMDTSWYDRLKQCNLHWDVQRIFQILTLCSGKMIKRIGKNSAVHLLTTDLVRKLDSFLLFR